jgi:lipopolysaccharide heptosyltransferase II
LQKILIIRLSSIGDIVLTSPIVRCLKKQMPEAELHFLIKGQFRAVVENNPYLSKVHVINTKNLDETARVLRAEKFDFVVDLHKNLRSFLLKRKLGKPSASFQKLNFRKYLLTQFKIRRMPKVHIVDRYFEAVKSLQVENDGEGLDYFIDEKDQVDLSILPKGFQEVYIGLVIGAKHFTKALPLEQVVQLIDKIHKPVVLLGGPEDNEKAEQILKNSNKNVFNACGKFKLNQSASLVQQAHKIITNDTGLMHIAAALKKEIISLWGNTVPEFGMFPYLPENLKTNSKIFQVGKLACRPCSKIGYDKCPKGHFNCMKKIDLQQVADACNG